MIITIGNMCGFRLVALAVIMSMVPTALGVAAVYPATWLCTALCMFIYYKSGRWKPDCLPE